MYTAGSGKFSSDRTIREYAEDIWWVHLNGEGEGACNAVLSDSGLTLLRRAHQAGTLPTLSEHRMLSSSSVFMAPPLTLGSLCSALQGREARAALGVDGCTARPCI